MGDTASPQATSIQQDLQRSYGSNWTLSNMSTLSDWITIAAHNMQILGHASKYYQSVIQTNLVVGLVLSTAAGTISTARFTTTFDSNINMVFNGVFTFMTFATACVTGYIKIFQIQEKLEECIQLRQDWVTFGSAIASELQLPVELRHDALYVITKNKLKYLDLLKARPDVPEWCVTKAKKELASSAGSVNLNATNLAHTIMDIAKQEMMEMTSKVDDASQTSSMPTIQKLSVRTTSKVQVQRDQVQRDQVQGGQAQGNQVQRDQAQGDQPQRVEEAPQSLTLTVGKATNVTTGTNTANTANTAVIKVQPVNTANTANTAITTNTKAVKQGSAVNHA
jgi:hypothetical protein